MPISEIILKKIRSSEATEDEKKLMEEILRIEDKGSFRYQQDYEKTISKYIAKHEEEVLK